MNQLVPPEVIADLDSLAQRCTESMDTFQESLAAMEIHDKDLAKKDEDFLESSIDLVGKVKVFNTESRLASSIPVTSASSSRGLMEPCRRINDLKPEKLLLSACLSEFRFWKGNFRVYFAASNMERLPINEQQGYLRVCLDMKLQLALSVNIFPLSSMDECVGFIGETFLSNIPALTRRFNFFSCDQHVAESILQRICSPDGDWHKRFQVEGGVFTSRQTL